MPVGEAVVLAEEVPLGRKNAAVGTCLQGSNQDIFSWDERAEVIPPMSVELYRMAFVETNLPISHMERTKKLLADIDPLVSGGFADAVGGPFCDFDQEQARHDAYSGA